MHTTRYRWFGIFLLAAGLSGCGSMRSYDSELQQTVAKAASGNLDHSLAELEKNNPKDKDLLYYLEKGELLRLKGDYPRSQSAWGDADGFVRQWEEEAKYNAEKLLAGLGSVLINDKMTRYDGLDYEKVMLSTRAALNHVASGDWQAARVEIKKTHEREAIIAELRAKEIARIEKDAKQREVKTEFKDLKGYPVETLNDPAVTALKNSYQSAFSHYLAGFVYEALDEPSLAAPGYRSAIELNPGIALLEDGLKSLESRPQARNPTLTDTLIVVESGMVPARQSESITLPVPLGSGQFGIIPISFPVIRPDKSAAAPHSLVLDGTRSVALATVTDLDLMARRALKDEMPGIMLRGSIRAIAKGIAQKKAQDSGQGAGKLIGSLYSLASLVTESADERGWRTLPRRIMAARLTLPSGPHSAEIATPAGVKRITFEVSGKQAIIPLRLMGNEVFAMRPLASLPAAVAAAPVQPVLTPPATTQPAPADDEAELSLWEHARSGGTAADFTAYLEKHPDGHYAAQAKTALASMAPPEPSVTEAATATPEAQAEPAPATRALAVPVASATEPIAPPQQASAAERAEAQYQNAEALARQGQAAEAEAAYRQALALYREAGEQKDAYAQGMVGYLYRVGKGTAKNPAEATKWFRLAAEQGSATAQVNLAFMLERGLGMEKNLGEAVAWYRKAAAQGDGDAQKELQRLGVPQP